MQQTIVAFKMLPKMINKTNSFRFNRLQISLSILGLVSLSSINAQAQLAGCPASVLTTGSQTITCSSSSSGANPYAISTYSTSSLPPGGASLLATNTYDSNIVTINTGTSIQISGSPIGLASGSTVTNNGILISTGLTYAYGISFGANGRSQNGGNTVTNTGSITTDSTNADGIMISATKASSTANTVSNTGTISTTGSGANGITLKSGTSSNTQINTISNAGTITVTGANSIGIDVQGQANVTNNGTINAGTNGTAVTFENGTTKNGLSNSLTLGTSSTTTGAINFNNANTAETLTFNGLVNSNFNNAITGLNTINATSSANVNMSNSNGYTLVGGKVNVDNTSSLTISSQIIDFSSSKPSSLNKIGAGTLTLSGINTYTGATTIDAGTLAVSGQLSDSTPVTIASGATYQAQSTDTIGSLAGAGSVVLSTGTVLSTGANNSSTTFSGVISGNAALTKVGTGIFTLSGTNSYTGPTTINAGTLALTGSITSDTTVSANGQLQGGGTINGNLTNAGNITPSISGNLTNLTINGNYVGQSGIFNTNVYAPNTSPTADQLIITGNTSGTTSIKVIDKGGLGNLTTGNGIQVVTVGGTTNASNFVLNGRAASGAYEYKLYKGDASGSGNNWYLSTNAQVIPVVAITPDARERIEVAVYPAVPTLARTYINTTVDTLDQRRGDLSLLDLNQGPGTTRDWARLIGTNGKLSPDDINNGPKLNFNSVALQFGTDLYRNQGSDGSRTYFGPYATVGNSNTSTFNTAGSLQTGSAKLDAYTLGLNATHFIGNGVYFDGLLQGTRFANVTASSTQNADIKTNGWGFAGSLETGIQIPLSQKVSLTPQAQVVFSSNSLSNGSDAYGQINFQQDNSTRARLGLMLSGKETEGDKLGSFWLRTSIWESFNSSTTTSFQSLYGVNAVAFNSVIGGRWISVDGGFTARLSKSSYAFLNASVETSINNPTYQTVSGRFGVQTRW